MIAGKPRNNMVVQLQRKTAACGARGKYVTMMRYRSGRNLDDGMVRYRLRIARSACYRLLMTNRSGSVVGAPFSIGARAVVRFTPLQRSVKRGTQICARLQSGQVLRGTLRIQYRVGKKWQTARSVPMRGARTMRPCFGINRAGVFPVRAVLTNLRNPRGLKQYEMTIASGGPVVVKDGWLVVR